VWALVVLLGASQVRAQTAIRLVWSASTAGGVTGGATIEPTSSGILTLDVLLDTDSSGVIGIEMSVVYAGTGLTALSPLVSGTECPEHSGICITEHYGGTGHDLLPLQPGASFEPGLVSRIDAANIMGAMCDATGVVLARIDFDYTGGDATIDPITNGGRNSVFDGSNLDISALVQANSLGATVVDGIVPEPDVDVSPLTVDFGDVDLGGSLEQIVTISNAGDADLTLTSDVILGAGSAPEFLIVSAPTSGTVLAPGWTEDVVIRFSPSAEPAVAGTLEIASDDPDGPLVIVDLVGSGVPFDDQAIAVIDEVFDPAVVAGTLEGDGPGGSAGGCDPEGHCTGRIGALRGMIEAAGDLIDAGFIDEACNQLLDAQNRTDGLFPPPDFVTGPSAPVLYHEIGQLRSNLGCAEEAVGASRAAAPEPPPPPRRRCGLGAELALLLPPLFWLWRRRLSATAG
jgi:hypothetical protein